jgi:hypothetical protein
VASGGSQAGGVAGSMAGTGGAAGAGAESIPPLACNAGERVSLPPEVIANRLSRLFFEEPATDALIESALRDGLETTGAVGCFARNLLEDPRADLGVSGFFGGWLDLAKRPVPLQDPMYVPEFSPELLARAKEASLWYAASITRSGGSFTRLLQDQAVPAASTLLPFYGVSLDGTEDFSMLDLHGERFGILTQLYFLMSRATAAHGSPTQRGAGFSLMLGCAAVPSPPPPLDLGADVPAVFDGTTRAFYASVSDAVCAGCHSYLTFTGFAFEHFDVLGRYRDEEAGEPIDASATLTAIDDTGGAVNGHVEAMRVTAASPIARSCFARHWLTYAVASLAGERRYAPDILLGGADADHVFWRASYDPDFDLREMFVAGVETAAFLAP